jgi:hypothetical protein
MAFVRRIVGVVRRAATNAPGVFDDELVGAFPAEDDASLLGGSLQGRMKPPGIGLVVAVDQEPAADGRRQQWLETPAVAAGQPLDAEAERARKSCRSARTAMSSASG